MGFGVRGLASPHSYLGAPCASYSGLDVPVVVQLKFLQSYENVEVPQIPSSTECFQLCFRGEYVQCKLCKSRMQFFDVVYVPFVVR